MHGPAANDPEFDDPDRGPGLPPAGGPASGGADPLTEI